MEEEKTSVSGLTVADETHQTLLDTFFAPGFDEKEFISQAKRLLLSRVLDPSISKALTQIIMVAPLSEHDEKILRRAHFLSDIVDAPFDTLALIASFAETLITIGHGNPLHYVLNTFEETVELTGQHHCENSVVLESPQLLGNSKLPFEVSFRLDFTNRPGNGVGRHGGILFGSNDLTNGRWAGHKSKADGALLSNIDWIDRTSDHGLRVYGVTHSDQNPSPFRHYLQDQPDPPSKWRLVFDENKHCTFIADDVIICKFEPVRCSGYIGFWSYNQSDMQVLDLDIRRL